MRYFVTGIGTNVGKTVVSAVLTEALKADYWKPVQSGTIEGCDSETVKALISNSRTVIHPEVYLLKQPLSPHFAAKIDGVEIDLNRITVPETSNHLIIEGAGGLLVPLNDEHDVIDLARQFDCEIILVISDYLGCINHSLLSLEYLKTHGYKIHSLVFNGDFAAEVKNAIILKAGDRRIISIPRLAILSKETLKDTADRINEMRKGL
jgi:dethiobiotin synthetase